MEEAAYTLIMMSRSGLPPPSKPAERQLTLDKWKHGEEIMKSNPEIKECIVERSPGHVYKVVRTSKGRLARIHETT